MPLFKRLLFLVFYLGLMPVFAFAQTDAYVQGHIRDQHGKPIHSVNVSVQKALHKTISSDSGFYRLKTFAYKQLTILYTCIGFQAVEKKVRLEPGETVTLDIELPFITQSIGEVSITGGQDRALGVSNVDVRNFGAIPNPSGNIESLIKTLPGVSSSNELSSQYSVRGGNFDENLVYVNDIEVVRPFLIRSGQQEGLSFINPDLVSSVKFSAGGFEAKYGDKMSSVLDVAYRKPVSKQYSLSASLLGANAAFEGVSKNSKFSYIAGARYKTSKYLLNSMDTKGEYAPAFVDIQSFVNYQLAKKLEINALLNFSQNSYEFVPQNRSTNFGTIQQVYNLTIYYDGKELDRYNSSLGAISLNFKPKDNLSLKLNVAGHTSYEQETFDIEGAYLLNEIDESQGSSSFGDSLANIGVGSMFNHARNFLWINSWTLSHTGTFLKGLHTLRWSVELKNENIKDKLNEWTLMDSAGYSSPYSPTSINLSDYAYARNSLHFKRISAYIQDTYQFSLSKSRIYLNGGVRLNYWDYNKELLISPRFRISLKPSWKRDMMFYIASGVYYQSPFYKEMRDFHGQLNASIKAQQSIHLVLGTDYNLKLWDRPFKFTSEIYYKWLNRLIPYKVDNVRTRYIARNNAKGYASGIEFKLNGEFVPGIESWASLSFMKTEENQNDDSYVNAGGLTVYPGYYPRPTDQRIIFSLFFQDYLPNNPTLQMHLNLVYGSPVHVSPAGSPRFDNTFAMGPYRRVDLGFSKVFKDQFKNANVKRLKRLKEFLVSLEVFNLLNTTNKASYLWVKTVANQDNMPNEFAVPNYLTSRRLNVKASVKF